MRNSQTQEKGLSVIQICVIELAGSLMARELGARRYTGAHIGRDTSLGFHQLVAKVATAKIENTSVAISSCVSGRSSAPS